MQWLHVEMCCIRDFTDEDKQSVLLTEYVPLEHELSQKRLEV